MEGPIREMLLAGVSTPRVGEALEAIRGERVSAQTVSRVARSLDREAEAFRERRQLPADYLCCGKPLKQELGGTPTTIIYT